MSQKQSENRSRGDPGDAYRYRNSRPFGVFGLAGLASLGALGLVWAAWSTIDDARQDERLAEPPNLKGVVENIEARARRVVPPANAASEADKSDRSLTGENSDDQ